MKNIYSFLDNVIRISNGDILPVDYVRALQNNKLEEYEFEYNECQLKLIDIGQIKLDQKRILHMFDNILCVLLCFDCKSLSEELKLTEEVQFFDNVRNDSVFKDFPLIVSFVNGKPSN